MISTPWDAPDLENDQASLGRSAPTLVSLHFVRSALRRHWLACMTTAVAGMLLAAAFLVAFPVLHEAKATLVLTHESSADTSQTTTTDVSLLKTRTLAARAIGALGLAMSPDDFLKTISVEPVSDELLTISLTAPSDAEAVRRLRTLTSIYLDFRGQQLSMQSNFYVQGLQQRITKLQGEVTALSRQIDQLSAASSPDDSKLSDIVSQRAYFQGQIDTLQQQIEDVTLQTSSIVLSSRVVDPAAVEPQAAKRRIALALASGLIGGAALGCGAVLFFAITSDRLRRRADIAAALDVPVPVSVGKITPVPQRWLWLPYLRKLNDRRTNERLRLARAIEMELPTPRRSGPIAVACIDNADDVCFVAADAAADLMAGGSSVAVIDLTKDGSVVAPSVASSSRGLNVLRPRGIPELASSASDLRVVGQEDQGVPALELSDVNLVLADLDPSVGADHLTAWTRRVIVVVTAGRSSAERVRTAADLIRAAGLEPRFAVLLHVERTDESSGTEGFDRPLSSHLEPSGGRVTSGDGLTLAQAEEADLLQNEFAELTAGEQALGVELGLNDEQIVDARAASSLNEVAQEVQVPGEELLVEQEKHSEGPATAHLGLATAEARTAEEEEGAQQELATPEEHTPEEEETGAHQVQATSYEQQVIEEHAASLVEYPQVRVDSAPGSEVEYLVWNWDRSPGEPDIDHEAADGWHLYADAYALGPGEPAPGPEDEELEWTWDWKSDDHDTNQDVVVLDADADADADDEGEVVTSEPWPSPSPNGEGHIRAAEGDAQENARPEMDGPADDGQEVNGQGRQRTRTRSRRRRSRLK